MGAFQGKNVVVVVLVILRCNNKLSLYQEVLEMKDSGPKISVLHVLER